MQDIEAGFGESGVRTAPSEATPELRTGGTLTLLDELPSERFNDLLNELPLLVIDQEERALDAGWDDQVAERAIPLCAQRRVVQTRTAN